MSASSAAPSPPQGRRVIAVIVLIPVFVTLSLWAFAWPASRTAPRELPVGVAGPVAATEGVQKQLQQKQGAFKIHRYADEAAARDAIENRTVYGAVVVTGQGSKLLTASAASTVVAQLLQQAVTAGTPKGTQVQITDVVAAPAKDPRGAVLNSSLLPMTLAGIAAGAVITLLGLRGSRAVVALLGSAALVGIVAATLTHNWLGALTGNWWAEAGTLGLTALAVGATVAGLAALIGPAGIGVGSLLSMLIGNPFSGMTSAPELLPEPAGVIGQWLPPGAGGALLRSVSFFDGAQAVRPAITLAIWVVAGLSAVLLATLRARPASAAAPRPASKPVPVG
ncbi:ABC transporter permease [Streptomyces katrae]|uniref:ABC transporter permease n=1 Tax=Streptomyces katrae TaxID=68223 RepID=UPI0004C0F20B|nr:ABC transporter permease [Streptomyces katrae]